MGVVVSVEGRLVTVHASGRFEERDAFPWVERVRDAAERIGQPIDFLAWLDESFETSIAALAGTCRASLCLPPYIHASAIVCPKPLHRTLMRSAVAVVSPPHPVQFFAQVEPAREWLASLEPPAARWAPLTARQALR